MLRLRALIPLLFTAVQPVIAATALIPLEHRTAAELLPAAQALLDEGETLVPHDNQFLVRASLERINELRGILSQLDTPARQLLISLYDSADPMPSYSQPGSTHSSARQAPRIISAGHSDRLQIRASEGQPAFLELTRREPRLGFSADLDGTPYLQSQESESGTGLHVVVHLRGNNQVQLDISTRRSTPDPAHPGAQKIMQSDTRINGRLGEWISIAGSGAQPGSRSRLSAGSEDIRPLRIRVDTLD